MLKIKHFSSSIKKKQCRCYSSLYQERKRPIQNKHLKPDEVSTHFESVQAPLKGLPIVTRVPYLDTSAFHNSSNVYKLANKIKGNPILNIHRNIVKKLFSYKFLSRLNSNFWNHTLQHSALAVAALSETLETDTVERLETLLTPAAFLILRENFFEFKANHNYRIHIEDIRSKFLNVEYTVNCPEFADESPAIINVVKGLDCKFSVPKTNESLISEKESTFLRSKAIREYQKLKYTNLLNLTKKNTHMKKDIPLFTGTEDSLRIKSDVLSSVYFKPSFSSFYDYIESTKKLSGDYLRDNSTVTIRASYLIDSLHYAEVWKKSGEKIIDVNKERFKHILTIENEVSLREEDKSLGQWRISDFDMMVKTEAYNFSKFLKQPTKYLDGLPRYDIDGRITDKPEQTHLREPDSRPKLKKN